MNSASLIEFARSGQLGPLALGLSRGNVTDLLGPPTDWLAGKTVARSAVWKYGDAEIYFDRANRIELIHFDTFEVPGAGPTLDLQPWVIRRGLPLHELELALHAEHIPFSSAPDATNPGFVRVLTSAGVYFLVQVEGEGGERDLGASGLELFGCAPG